MSDLSKLSYADLRKQQEQIAEQQRQIATLLSAKRGEELKVLVDGFVQKVKAADFTVAELLEEISKYAAPKKSRAAKGTAQKQPPVSEDKDGHMPELGATYKHPETGESWTKTGGRPKQSFIDAIGKGHTWAEMRAKK